MGYADFSHEDWRHKAEALDEQVIELKDELTKARSERNVAEARMSSLRERLAQEAAAAGYDGKVADQYVAGLERAMVLLDQIDRQP